MKLNVEEQVAMDHLLAFMVTVQSEWGLKHNQSELVIGIHMLQGFILQHMLQRVNPDEWGEWFEMY